MILYRLLLGIACAAAAILACFFLWGLSDGTIGRANIVIWLLLLGVNAAIIWGAIRFRAKGQTRSAVLLLFVPAFPALCFGLLMLAMILLQPDWR